MLSQTVYNFTRCTNGRSRARSASGDATTERNHYTEIESAVRVK